MHDNDDAISEINSGESSSSVATNHVQDKQSPCLNHSQIVDMVFIFFSILLEGFCGV